MRGKSQAAIEYVVILGIIILIILIASSSISSNGIFDFSKNNNLRSSEISNILNDIIVQYALNSDGKIQFSVKTNTIDKAKNTIVTVFDSLGNPCSINFGLVTKTSEAASINCLGFNGSAGNEYAYNISVKYTDDLGLNRSMFGVILGRYEAGDSLITGFAIFTENVNASGYNITADYFIGSGALLSGINAYNNTYHNYIYGGDSQYNSSYMTSTYNSTYHAYVYGGDGLNPLQYNPSTKRQLADLSTNDNLTWSQTDIIYDLIQDVNYNLRCDILYTGAAATTGQVINLTTNASTSNVNIMYDTWSSATASVGLSATSFNTALIGTGSGATIIKPNTIIADFKAINNGTLKLLIRSEILGSDTAIKRGSKCDLYNVGSLQQTPINNNTQITPAIKSQRIDVSTINNTIWSNTNMSFDLESSKKYYLRCDILYTGAAATTGQMINLTTNASTSNVNIMYDTWSSATASVGLSATSFNTALIGTGSGATIIKPNTIIADFETTSTGILNLTIRSEVSNSTTTLLRGSMCYLYDLT